MTKANGKHTQAQINFGQTASVDPVRQKFLAAIQQYTVKNYATANILFERIRNMVGVAEPVKRDCLYNMGMANLRLNWPATAILYFERYLSFSGLSVADRSLATTRLNEAKRRTGIPI